MKFFLDRYSYDSVRLLLNQIAISMFGFALAMTAQRAENDTLLTVTSIASILFYLALEYGVAWKMGSNDRTGIRYGKFQWKPLTGLWVALLANSINFLLAILITIGTLGNIPALAAIPRTVALLAQGMYMGLLATVEIGDTALNSLFWVYFLLPLPAMLISLVGYVTGYKDIHITSVGIPDLPESDRPTKAERKAAKKAKKD